MIVSKSVKGTEPLLSTNGCMKVEYTKTREANIDLIISGQQFSCLLDTGNDVTLFPHALVRSLPLN